MDADSRLILETGKRALVAQRLRLHFAALGCPVDHLSDDEVEAGIKRVSEASARVGFTVEQAATALTRFAATGINYFDR